MFDYTSFNPSVGIAFIQTRGSLSRVPSLGRFNPSVGIAFIQTDSVYASHYTDDGFNPSVGIAFIQTACGRRWGKDTLLVSIPQSG